MRANSWWLESLPAEAADLARTVAGLSAAEAVRRLVQFGPNLFRERQQTSVLRQYLARFKNPRVLVLLVASAFSAFSGEVINFLIITFIVLLSVSLDFVQEYRANAAAEKLKLSVSVRAIVIRDGKPLEVSVAEVVPGDVALLAAGDLIPADGRVIEASDFFVMQALLTGESFPVEKRPGVPPETATDLQEAILALKARDHLVGYLGDGINDAPSLHSADVGLSVDSGVDVAKEAADMILLKHDLHVLHAGVLEGRHTFGNIMKYIMMGTSSNFGNMFSMAGASLFLPFLPTRPTQILLNNILYDISEVPIPLDKVDTDEIVGPRVLDLNFIRNFMLVIGLISSAVRFSDVLHPAGRPAGGREAVPDRLVR